jgi:ABC-type bacteriocin/lantibiotic exporter with double-glycine peptidase domain
MVLAGLGVEIEEARLRQLTDCSPLGTDAFLLVEAARQLGFTASRKYTLASLNELAGLLDEALFPIVYVDLWPIKGGLSGQYHSLVVIAIERESMIVLDPLVGERRLPREDFQTAWEAMHFLTIVISD